MEGIPRGRCATAVAALFVALFSLSVAYSSWPGPPIHNVVNFANSSDLIVIGTVTSKGTAASTGGGDTYHNATIKVDKVLKGSCASTILLRVGVMPQKGRQSNPQVMVGDRVFLLLFEYPTNSSEKPSEGPVEKWYNLGVEDYVWVIDGGTVYNRWERYMKESLDAPEEVIKSYGWTYSLEEFLDLVSTAISDPGKADAYSLKPLPTQQIASIAITLVVILPSIFVAMMAARNWKRIHKENAT